MKKFNLIIMLVLLTLIAKSQYHITGDYKISGKLGIGTENLQEKLNLLGNLNMVGSDRRIFMGGVSGTTFGLAFNSTYPNYGIFYTEGSADYVSISPNGNATNGVLNIFGDGKVGIGTSTPKSKFDLGSNYSDPSTYPNKITLWSSGENNYFGFGISSSNLDYFSQGNHRFYTEYNGTPGSEKMVIKSNGNIGIGKDAPSYKLDMQGAGRKAGIHLKKTDGVTASWYLHPGRLGTGEFTIGDDTHYRLTILSNGNVGIGTTNPGIYRLAVEGVIGAREVVVTTDAWSDFVFEPAYKLIPLENLEQFIKQNKHLPDVPSAEEIRKNGLSLGQNDAILLQKVEELTLYLIEQNKMLKAQNDKIIKLEEKNIRFEKKIEKLKQIR